MFPQKTVVFHFCEFNAEVDNKRLACLPSYTYTYTDADLLTQRLIRPRFSSLTPWTGGGSFLSSVRALLAIKL